MDHDLVSRSFSFHDPDYYCGRTERKKQRENEWKKERKSHLCKTVTGSPTVLRCQVTQYMWGYCVLPIRNLTRSCIGFCPPCCTASHGWLHLVWAPGCHTYGSAGLKHREKHDVRRNVSRHVLIHDSFLSFLVFFQVSFCHMAKQVKSLCIIRRISPIMWPPRTETHTRVTMASEAADAY